MLREIYSVNAAEKFAIIIRMLDTGVIPDGKIFQLNPQYRALNAVHPAIHANSLMEVFF
ncbi:hypothetical protein D3C83_308470 [compost metagenome]